MIKPPNGSTIAGCPQSFSESILLPPEWVRGTIIAKGVISFYLKRIRRRGAYHYIISQTYLDRGVLTSRDLMDLGPDPSIYIQYFDRYGFAFQSVIEENLQKSGARFESDEIERLLKPFLKPEIRRIVETFEQSRHFRLQVSCNLEELVPGQRQVHLFDARRLYYLRLGRIDSGELAQRNWKLLNVFLCKSRDEIESELDIMEQALPPGEYPVYVYASLGVPLLLPQHLRDYPSAFERERLDRLVLLELCKINSDEDFFLGVKREDGFLHEYLRKYAWYYFDSEFRTETLFDGFRFAGRPGKPPQLRPALSLQDAYRVFEISSDRFSRMTTRELTSIFRRKAKKIHPDRGGKHEDFLRLSEAYGQLMEIKKKTGPGRK